MRKKPLGSAEKEALMALLDRGGSWSPADRPLWESRQWTLQLLYALACKELVREVVPDKQYELTSDGRRVSAELRDPWRPLKSAEGNENVHFPTQNKWLSPWSSNK